MLNETLISIYKRDLDIVIDEIKLYQAEEDIWKTADGINNSAGNLILHILGNLNHFVGAQLGKTQYVRDRPAEFSSKNIASATMIAQIEDLKKMIETTLSAIQQNDFEETYPIDVFGYKMTTEYFLIHLLAHLSYHLGQINYHRRLVC
jgi:uncharacterized damage-inducible protein DinB